MSFTTTLSLGLHSFPYDLSKSLKTHFFPIGASQSYFNYFSSPNCHLYRSIKIGTGTLNISPPYVQFMAGIVAGFAQPYICKLGIVWHLTLGAINAAAYALSRTKVAEGEEMVRDVAHLTLSLHHFGAAALDALSLRAGRLLGAVYALGPTIQISEGETCLNLVNFFYQKVSQACQARLSKEAEYVHGKFKN